MIYKSFFTALAVAVLLSLFYFVISPKLEGTEEIDPNKPLIELQDKEKEYLVSVTIQKPNEPEIYIERKDLGPRYIYEIKKPIQKLADFYMVEDINYIIRRLNRMGYTETKGVNLKDYGLDKPISAAIETKFKKFTLRFGRENPFEEGGVKTVFYQLETEPKYFYLVSKSDYDLFTKTAEDWRSKQILETGGMNIDRIVIEKRYEKGAGNFQYDKVVLEQSQNPDVRSYGWYLLEPYAEEADSNKVSTFINMINELRAIKFIKFSDLKEYGLDLPELKVQLFSHGNPNPLEIHFGKTEIEKIERKEGEETKVEERKRIYIYILGQEEVNYCDGERYKDLPKEPSDFRYVKIFHFSEDEVWTIDITYQGRGQVVLVKKEVIQEREGKKELVRRWFIEAPKEITDIKPELRGFQEQRIRQFLDSLLQVKIEEFLVRSVVKTEEELNKECKITFSLKRGQHDIKKTFYAMTEGGRTRVYAKLGPDTFEVFEVEGGWLNRIKVMEHNFKVGLYFEAPKESIDNFVVEIFSESASVLDRYRCTKIVEAGELRWQCDKENENMRTDQEAVDKILNELSKIEPLIYVTKNPEDAEVLGLNNPSIKVELTYKENDQSKRKVLLISPEYENQVFFAKFADDNVIFQLRHTLPESLLRGGLRRKLPAFKPKENK